VNDGEEVVCKNRQEADQSRCGGREISPARQRAESGARGEDHHGGESSQRDRQAIHSHRWQISAVRRTMVETVPTALTDPT